MLEKGHAILDCTNEPFCLDCSDVGHRTNSEKCPRKSGCGKLDATPSQNIQVEDPSDKH